MSRQSGAIGILHVGSLETWDQLDERFCVTGIERFVEVTDGLHLRYCHRDHWVTLPPNCVGNTGQDWTPLAATMSSRFGANIRGYLGEVQHFAERLVSGEEPRANLEDSFWSLLVAEAVWKSAQTGQAATIEG